MPNAARSDGRPFTTAQFFPVTHSLLSADALGRHVHPAYDIDEVRACVPLQHNLNDTYLVDATTGRYVLRVSQTERAIGYSWRAIGTPGASARPDARRSSTGS